MSGSGDTATESGPKEQPKGWPKEALDSYNAIRPLGKGAFGLVWLARAKEDGGGDDSSEYVAIKHIKTASETERAYAEREISILSELDHPCIIKLVKAYDPPSSTSKSRLVVMSLANGPDVGSMIEMGGALSFPLCRLIARHLISAVSYLHGRGVLHRDLKPDNIILVRKGGSPETASAKDDIATDDTLWCKTGDKESDDSLEGKWKAVLVDFGFARALSPTDVMGTKAANKRMRNSIVMEGDAVAAAAKAALEKGAKDDKDSDDDDPFGGEVEDDVIKPLPNMAASKPKVDRRAAGRASMATMQFKMSALGTKAFAAPEIKNKARTEEAKGGQGGEDKSSALTACVADYGMISDAFAVGTTLRMCLTGVPADENNVEFVSSKNSPVAQIMSAIFGACASKDDNKRKKQYRYLSGIPKDANNLLRDLTKPKEEDRITVRQAQESPYIKGGDGEAEYRLPVGDYPSTTGSPINFLKCAS